MRRWPLRTTGASMLKVFGWMFLLLTIAVARAQAPPSFPKQADSSSRKQFERPNVPVMYLARHGELCTGHNYGAPISRLYNGQDMPKEYWKECIPFAVAPENHRIPLIIMDADELPFVWACTASDISRNASRKPLWNIFFMCGMTLSKWVIDESGRQPSDTLLKSIGHQATMSDVRKIARWGEQGK